MDQKETKTIKVNLDTHFWNSKYEENKIGWDIGYANPIHIEYVLEHIDKSQKILIPGAGSGYEIKTLWNYGYNQVYAIDLSPLAKKRFLKQQPDFPEENYIVGDFFKMQQSFDLILEQTFFCAIDPALRSSYVEKIHEVLNPLGRLYGVLFVMPLIDGPPFGGSVKEYQHLFEEKFEIIQIKKNTKSIPTRLGKEIIIELLKK